MHLEVSDLTHRFERRDTGAAPALAIDGLAAGPGALTVLTGPSGSGKSTALYLFSGLLRPTTGAVTWEGADLAAMGESARDAWRRKHAGFVFQNFHLITEMTPVQNVVIAGYFAGWSARHLEPRGRELLEEFGVPVAPRPVASFSRGEQQRIALARALVFDPQVIFADEPTASLDAASADAIATLLADLAAAGKTVIAVSHDPALTGRADTLHQLDHGRLANGREAETAA